MGSTPIVLGQTSTYIVICEDAEIPIVAGSFMQAARLVREQGHTPTDVRYEGVPGPLLYAKEALSGPAWETYCEEFKGKPVITYE